MDSSINHLSSDISHLSSMEVYGTVTSAGGLLIKCKGLQHAVSLGSRCKILSRDGRIIYTEVVELKDDNVHLMPFSSPEGVGVGCKVYLEQSESSIYPDKSWLGRVLNAFAEPVDEKGGLTKGKIPYSIRSQPPPAHKRRPVGEKLDVGVRAINTFTSCCKGQRMGIFSGSGVGKSMLIAMLTKFCHADVRVIGLVGERGREVHEFIHQYLGPEEMKKTVLVVATSDESALMRRQAAYVTLSIAEYFRDLNKNVLCLMDSVTRFAMAQREIGLSAGETPASKGYTPSVFVELPKLLERAGPGEGEGTITGLFTVLVEGDDHNEPISDAVRGILDGHIILERSIAERGRFPAINVLRSISRTMPGCNSDEENKLVQQARKQMSVYADMEEMIRLGAYRKGSNEEVDHAIDLNEPLENFLAQEPNESSIMADGYKKLKSILRPDDQDIQNKSENKNNVNKKYIGG